MSSDGIASISFERSALDNVTLLAMKMCVSIVENTNRTLMTDSVKNSLLSLYDDHPNSEGYPEDRFQFTFNGNSFSLLWEKSIYNTDIGEVIYANL